MYKGVISVLNRMSLKSQLMDHLLGVKVFRWRSGDAEQIILFESIDKYTGKSDQQGSIDNEIMISRVKEVMEGGDLAFHTRAQKYRYTP